MKHSKLLGLIISAIPAFLFSQDVMVLKNSDEIKAKVVELTDLIIKYKKWENINGPTYNISKTEVLFIRYENGIKEVIGTIENKPAVQPESQNSSEPLANIYSTEPQIRRKRMVRLSWSIANAEFYDSKLTKYGFGSIGYNSGLDIGLRLYEKNQLELGLQITPLSVGIHSTENSYEFASQMETTMNNSTNSNDWYTSDYLRNYDHFNGSVAFGIYAIKNSPSAAIKLALQVGKMYIDTKMDDATISSYFPDNDDLRILAGTDFKTSAYINPSLSILIGKPKSRLRWSIEMGYKSMWYTSINSGWISGTIYGQYVYQTIEPTYDIGRTGIFNLGVGISGF
jgi:hypothetical protein